jgi:hypothetical protein
MADIEVQEQLKIYNVMLLPQMYVFSIIAFTIFNFITIFIAVQIINLSDFDLQDLFMEK